MWMSRTRIGWLKKGGARLDSCGFGISLMSDFGGSQRMQPVQMSQSSGRGRVPLLITVAVLWGLRRGLSVECCSQDGGHVSGLEGLVLVSMGWWGEDVCVKGRMVVIVGAFIRWIDGWL